LGSSKSLDNRCKGGGTPRDGSTLAIPVSGRHDKGQTKERHSC
jgi:hypothetical protein